MPTTDLGRHTAALGLLISGSVALLSAQHVLGSVADAEMTEAVAVDFSGNRTERAAPVQPSSSLTMSAAASTGSFEELVRPTPIPTTVPTAVPTVAPAPSPTVVAPALSVFETGIASTYGEGDGFEGNRTACGQVFHTQIVQIAHKSLPCGTLVRVEDTVTGRTVEAEVTDRGPYIPGRVVDLSWGAFKELDPTGPGLLYVNVYVLDN
jgi:rare lipoprotein A (peptidoglycan hydrolase)